MLRRVSDPYLLGWWARDFGSWHSQYRAGALAPVQTRLSYYVSSKRARAILGQPRSTINLGEGSPRGASYSSPPPSPPWAGRFRPWWERP